MSVYDDTDYAYGTGRCCWCGAKQGNYDPPCRHGGYEYDRNCRKCKRMSSVVLQGYCSDCYRKM